MAVAYGTIAIVPKGVWNAGTEYNVGHLVELDGSSYVAKVKPPVGTLPTNTAYWQVSATGTSKATADSTGVVKPDGVTTEVDENAALSVKTAEQNAVGVVKGSAGIDVEPDGSLDVNTDFEQAAALANIIAGEAIAQVLGKVSKAIATTMNLDQNALLKNMLTGIDVNDANKVPNAAFIHTLVERIGMGIDLTSDYGNLTAAVNSVNQVIKKLNSDLGIIYKASSRRATIAHERASDITEYSEIVPKGTYIVIMRCSHDINQDLYNSKGERVAVGVGKVVVSVEELSTDTYHVVGANFTGTEISTSDDSAYFGLILVRLK